MSTCVNTILKQHENISADYSETHSATSFAAPLKTDPLVTSTVTFRAALWLLRLRWCAAIAQFCLFLTLLIQNAREPLALLVGTTLILVVSTNAIALSNLSKKQHLSRSAVGSLLLLDMTLLTFLLLFSGGPANPFTVLYLVHIILTAAVLGTRWTWGVAVSTILAFGLLFYVHTPDSLSTHTMSENHAHFSSHLYGMWLAFSLAAILIAVFVCTILSSLKERDDEVSKMRLQVEKNERFASLVTLAAGAAHELGSPLATIAVISGELERLATAGQLPDLVEKDAKLLRAEVKRCKAILDEMRGQADNASLEALRKITPKDLIDELQKSFAQVPSNIVNIDFSKLPQELLIPKQGLIRSLRAVIRNAIDASPVDSKVSVYATYDPHCFVFSVSDHGHGMSPEVLSHATEPFFTTKQTGEGMGLGLFLVRIFCEKYGGQLDIRSTPKLETVVILTLPRADIERKA